MSCWQIIIDSCRCTENSGPGTRYGGSFRGKQVSVQLLAAEDDSTRSLQYQQQDKVCFPSSLPGHPASHDVRFLLFHTRRTRRLSVGPIIPARGFRLLAPASFPPAKQQPQSQLIRIHPACAVVAVTTSFLFFSSSLFSYLSSGIRFFVSSTCCHGRNNDVERG